MSRYRTIGRDAAARIEVKRSIFEAHLARVESEPDARSAISAIRSAYPDARHHCMAMVIGPDADLERSSDDGEPAGTAGAPMLEVLRGAGLTDVVAVVTRLFGGTLLGAGGLVRAYSDATRLAVEEAGIQQRELQTEAKVVLPHAIAGRVENELRAQAVAILGIEYGAEATITIGYRPEAAAQVRSRIAELTAGGAEPQPIGKRWIDMPRAD